MDEFSISDIKRENEKLRQRLQHLLKSETIQLFDELTPGTGEYKRDIRRLDTYGLKYKLLQAEREGKAMDQKTENPPKAEKPPLGIVPRWLHEYERLADIAAATHRYTDAGLPIPQEWQDEFADLSRRMIERAKYGTE